MALEGIRGHADEVVVTVGSQQALDLITRIFIDPGDVVLAEAPSYVGALGTFASYQASVVHVPMDDDGIIPEALGRVPDQAGEPEREAVKFLYTVPNFAATFASVTLSAGRRAEVLRICQRAWPAPVDRGQPLWPAALRLRATCGRYALTIRWAWSISAPSPRPSPPGLRVGWAVAPPGIRDKLVLTAAEAAVLCSSSLGPADDRRVPGQPAVA